MAMTRRDFLKASGVATGAASTGLFSIGALEAKAEDLRLRIRYAKQTTTICPYCAVGCGEIVSASNGKVINIEGDPDHPINDGRSAARAAPSTRSPITSAASRRSSTGRPGAITGRRSPGIGRSTAFPGGSRSRAMRVWPTDARSTASTPLPPSAEQRSTTRSAISTASSCAPWERST